VRRDQVERLAGEALAVAGDGERGQPARARALGGAGEHRVDVRIGRVGDPCLLAGQAEAVAVALGAQGEGRHVRARLRLREREGGHRLAARQPVAPRRHQLRPPVGEDRVRAEPLDRERRLGLGAAPREPLPDEAEVHRGLGTRQQPVLRQRAHERPVHAPRLARVGDRGQHVARERGRLVQQPALLRREVEIQRAHRCGRTATPMSSTSASSSNRRVTPKSPIAG
jgi:hypothetical protein